MCVCVIFLRLQKRAIRAIFFEAILDEENFDVLGFSFYPAMLVLAPDILLPSFQVRGWSPVSSCMFSRKRTYALIVAQSNAFPKLDITLDRQQSHIRANQLSFSPSGDRNFSPLFLIFHDCKLFIWQVGCFGNQADYHSKFQLKIDFLITILDALHLLLRFNNEPDFLSVWFKETMYTNIFQFSNGLRCSKLGNEAPAIPAKILFLCLHVNL